MSTFSRSILLVAFAIATLAAHAQTSIGFRTGASFSDVPVSRDLFGVNDNIRGLVRPSVAAIVQHDLGETFALETGLQFQQKGFRINESTAFNIANVPVPVGVRVTTTLNYLELPLLGKVKFGEGPVQGYFIAGGAGGYALSGRLQTSARVLIDIPLVNTRLPLNASGFNRFELSGIAGAGVQVDAGAGKFIADVRYQHAFYSVYDIPVVDIPLRNQNWNVSVGYLFPLQR